MFALRLVSIAVVFLLFGRVTSAPIHNHRKGAIVWIKPSDTTGASVGTDNNKLHPHIVLGHDANNQLVVAPTTHGQSDHLKPYMPAPNEHGLQGVVRLDHIVVTNPDGVKKGTRNFKNKIVSNASLKNIQDAKDLVQAHYNAADHHNLAAEEHQKLHEFHNQAFQDHLKAGNTKMAEYHTTLSVGHQQHTEHHHAAASNHEAAALRVNGPDHAQLQHAQNSATSAHHAHAGLTGLLQQRQGEHTLRKMNISQAANSAKHNAEAKHAETMQHSHAAIQHANHATAHGHHP